MKTHYTTDLVMQVWRQMKEQLGELTPQVDVILRDGSHHLALVVGETTEASILRAITAPASCGQVHSIAFMADAWMHVPMVQADAYERGSARKAYMRMDPNASEVLCVTLIDADGGLYQAMQKYRNYGHGIYEWGEVQHMSGPDDVQGLVVDQLRAAMVVFG